MAEYTEISGTVEKESRDNIRIADDVIRSIAVIAAADVEGVAGIGGSRPEEIRRTSGARIPEKSVKMSMDGDAVRLRLPVTVRYGCSIPEICRNVQEKVRATVENMTGYEVSVVDVSIAGIETQAQQD